MLFMCKAAVHTRCHWHLIIMCIGQMIFRAKSADIIMVFGLGCRFAPVHWCPVKLIRKTLQYTNQHILDWRATTDTRCKAAVQTRCHYGTCHHGQIFRAKSTDVIGAWFGL